MWRKRGACESLAVELSRGAQRRRYEVTVISDVWPLKRRPRKQVSQEAAESKVFWRERAQRFHMDAHFPALVSEQVLPGWSNFKPEDEEHDTKHQSSSSAGFTLHKPTASIDAKQQSRREDDDSLPWVGGIAGADVCGRGPVLHLGDAYREPREPREPRERREPCEQRPEPLRPVGRASQLQRTCYTDLLGQWSCGSVEAKLQEIELRKVHGRQNVLQLRRRYAKRRDEFKERRSKKAPPWSLEEERRHSKSESKDRRHSRCESKA